MLNQTYHFKDFVIKVTWSFFCYQPRKVSLQWNWWYYQKINCKRKSSTSLSRSNTYSWGYDKVLSRKCPWNNCNLYLYSSGSAAKRFNERKIPTGQNKPRNMKLSLFWGSPRPQDCHEKNFKWCWFCFYLFVFILSNTY